MIPALAAFKADLADAAAPAAPAIPTESAVVEFIVAVVGTRGDPSAFVEDILRFKGFLLNGPAELSC